MLSLEGQDIVCFANDWSADPTSKHHLMREAARRNRVLWVEASGMRRPSLGDAGDRRRILRKLSRFVQAPRSVPEGLHVLTPPSLPLPAAPLADAANRLLYRWSVRRGQHASGMGTSPLLWAFAPHVAPWIRSIPRSALIYHCVDRWAAFKDYDAALMERCEAEICRAADLVVASAEDLADKCRAINPRTVYVPHGVSHAHFAEALTPGPIPADVASIPEPRIGFFGLIHEWVDVELIGALARVLPYSFVLIGDAKTDMTAVHGLPNVYQLGRRPFAELPAYCRAFAAAIVPFQLTALTRSVNPIKLREYAAAGLPIVSSDLPEVRRCGSIATRATGLPDWEQALRTAVARGQRASERRAQSERVRPEDWSFTLERIAGLLNGARST